MELFWKRDKWNYKITMKGKDSHGKPITKVYKTIDVIADMSKNLRGRATRVYEAYDVENPGSRVVIKDSWVDANRPKEADTLSELLDDASDDEKEMFLTVLVHGVVTVDGKEDLTQDLLMNGYMISTDDSSNDHSINERENPVFNELEEMMADAGITDDSVEDIAQMDHIYNASIFEVLKTTKPGSQPASVASAAASPDVSTTSKPIPQPRVYDPKAHYRIVFKERGQSLHSMSYARQIKLSLVVQAMHDVFKGSMILSNSASESF